MPAAARARTLAIAALLAAGCGAGAEKPRNVVLIVVDTLRADHLSLYGYARTTSPGLDRWAAESGVVFEQARAQAPCTFPSVNSLLTSRSPGAFLGGDEVSFGIPAAVPTLAGVLRAAGWSTAAVSASPIVRATPSKENRSGGFGAGFETFDEFCYWREAGCVTRRALDALGELREPWLLYVHYLDPHDPYRLPDNVALAGRFAGEGPPGPEKEAIRRGEPAATIGGATLADLGTKLDAADLAHLEALYDDEILYWDRELAPLRDAILRRGANSTVFALASDHGEQFLEHGYLKHCNTLYDVELRTPLVFFAPGVAPRRVASPVTNLDVVPTLLELARAPAATAGLEGRSLVPELRGESGRRPAPQFATFAALWGVTSGGFKLVLRGEPERAELYDLTADPGELRNLATSEPERRERLRRLLARWRERTAPGSAAHGGVEAEKLLRSVGYLQ